MTSRISKIFFSIAAVYLLLGSCAFAQSLPNAPSSVKQKLIAPLKSWSFYAGTATFAASEIADVHSTKRCEIALTCAEAYPGHNRYSYIAPQIALVALGTYGCELMLDEHRKWRHICLVLGVGMSFIHWQDAYTIYPNDRRARP